jgi:hypothetical protein
MALEYIGIIIREGRYSAKHNNTVTGQKLDISRVASSIVGSSGGD